MHRCLFPDSPLLTYWTFPIHNCIVSLIEPTRRLHLDRVSPDPRPCMLYLSRRCCCCCSCCRWWTFLWPEIQITGCRFGGGISAHQYSYSVQFFGGGPDSLERHGRSIMFRGRLSIRCVLKSKRHSVRRMKKKEKEEI